MRYYWGTGIGHTYSHIKPACNEGSHRSTGSRPESQHISASHEPEDNPVSGSDVEGDEEDFQDSHSSGESDAEDSSDEDEVLEMYFASDAGPDLMDVDEY